MKKRVMLIVTAVVFIFSSLVYAGGNSGHNGPAPNSGDCIPDGSGFDTPNGPNGITSPSNGSGQKGPAPNSGDGIPDGSGFNTSK